MSAYSEFPPINSFTAVLRNCPRAAMLYVDLWKSRKNCTEVYVKTKDVPKKFYTSITIFKNNLHLLQKENVLIFEKNDKFIYIELI